MQIFAILKATGYWEADSVSSVTGLQGGENFVTHKVFCTLSRLDNEDWAVPTQIWYQCSILGFIYSCKDRTWRRVLDVFCGDARNLFLKQLLRWRESKRSIWGREWSLHPVSVGGKGPFEGMTTRYWCSFRVFSMVSQSFLRWAAIDIGQRGDQLPDTCYQDISRRSDTPCYHLCIYIYIYLLKN